MKMKAKMQNNETKLIDLDDFINFKRNLKIWLQKGPSRWLVSVRIISEGSRPREDSYEP